MTGELKDLLIFTAKSIVDNPDEVFVDVVDKQDITTLELRVAKEDMGKIIGRNGRMAKDLRTIVRAAARDTGKVHVEIVDQQ